MNRIYLDNNATTQMAPEVLEAMTPFMLDIYGNASSVHQFGQNARKGLESAREQIASYLNCSPKELVFTSGGTESDNYALRGIAAAKSKKGNHIITSAIEHHAVLNEANALKKQGFDITILPVDQYGRVSVDAVADAIRDDTILISVMYANNEVGTIQPIAEIGALAKEKGVLFHTDAVQALGKLDVNVENLNVDLMSFSAHKVHGPKGVGLIYIRRGSRPRPLIIGGHHEKNRRAGTENVPGTVGFAKAVELAMGNLEEENTRIAALRDRLEEKILEKVDHVYVSGDHEHRLSNTLHLAFNFIEGEGILLGLDMQGIAVSTGSACTSGSLEPSHVLSAMNVPVELAQGGIRFSLSRYNTEAEMDYVADAVAQVVPRLRNMSPLWDKYKAGTLDMKEFENLACYTCRVAPAED